MSFSSEGKKSLKENSKGTNDKGDKVIKGTKNTENNSSFNDNSNKEGKPNVPSGKGSTNNSKLSWQQKFLSEAGLDTQGKVTDARKVSADDRTNTLSQTKLERQDSLQFGMRKSNVKLKGIGKVEQDARDIYVLQRRPAVTRIEALIKIMTSSDGLFKDNRNKSLKLMKWQRTGQIFIEYAKFYEALKTLYKTIVQNEEEVDITVFLTELKKILKISESNDSVVKNEEINFNTQSDEFATDLGLTSERGTQVETEIEQEPTCSRSEYAFLDDPSNTTDEQDFLHGAGADVPSYLQNCRDRCFVKQDMAKENNPTCEFIVNNTLQKPLCGLNLDELTNFLVVLVKGEKYPDSDSTKQYDEGHFADSLTYQSGFNNRTTHQNNILDKSYGCFQKGHKNEMTKHEEALMNRKNNEMSKRNNFSPGFISNDKFETLEGQFNSVNTIYKTETDNKLKPRESGVNGWVINDEKSSYLDESCQMQADPRILGNEYGMGSNTIEARERANKLLPSGRDCTITHDVDKPESQESDHMTKYTLTKVLENLDFSLSVTSRKSSTLDAVHDVNDGHEAQPEMTLFDSNEEETSYRESFQAGGSGIITESGNAELGTSDAEENLGADDERENLDYDRENENDREEYMDVDPDRENTEIERSRAESVENTDVERENLEDSARGDTDVCDVDVEGSSTDAQRENMGSIGNIGTEGEEDNAVEFGMATAVDEAREDRGGDGEDEVNADDETDRQVAVLPEDSEAHLSFLDHPFGDEDPDPMESFMFSFPGLEGGLTSGLTSLEALMADSTLRLDVMLENVIHQMLAMQPDLLHDEAAPPATEMVIDRVPEVTITAELLEQHPSCPICLCENQMHDTMSQLPCQHVFHPVCLRGWLVKSGTCPVCRSRL